MKGLEFLEAASKEVHEQVARHLTNLPSVRSAWRERARTCIIRALRGYSNRNEDNSTDRIRFAGYEYAVDNDTLAQRLHNSYTFGERRMTPYKAWLEEIQVLREVAQHIMCAWTEEMDHIIDVARDAEEGDETDERAVALLKQIDYPILYAACGVCGVKSTLECMNMDRMGSDPPLLMTTAERYAWARQRVPHQSRLPVSRPVQPTATCPSSVGSNCR